MYDGKKSFVHIFLSSNFHRRDDLLEPDGGEARGFLEVNSEGRETGTLDYVDYS